MTRIKKDFSSRDPSEQSWLLENTWCDRCNAADLGMSDPVEYEEDGVVRVEGRCHRCQARVVNVIEEHNG